MMEQLQHNPYEMLRWKIICCEQRIDRIINAPEKYPEGYLHEQEIELENLEATLIIVAVEYPECFI